MNNLWLVFPFLLIFGFSEVQAQATYDLRFVQQLTDCANEEILIDLEIKSNSVGPLWGLGIQNYRFNFNTTTVPLISPPISTGTPPDRSVFITQELEISGFVGTNFYGAHTLTGSSGNLVSYNVALTAGSGFELDHNVWTKVGRLRFNLADPMPPCLNLTWDTGSTLILTGAFAIAQPGTLNNLTICGICQSLPIELRKIQLTEIDCKAALEWETETETNNSHFLIEKSLDGVSFQVVGRVEGSGTSNEPQKYYFIDETESIDSYFRLRQVDVDGRSEVSETMFHKNSCISETETPGIVAVYPNPSNTSLPLRTQIFSPFSVSGSLNIYDIRGVLIRSKPLDLLAGQNLFFNDLNITETGMYFMQFRSEEWTSDSFKFLIR